MLATWMAQGQAVPIGASGPMMLGSVAVSIYALVCAQYGAGPLGIDFGRIAGLPLGFPPIFGW